MKGECLCGSIIFEISGEVRHFYRCHCLLCRKQSGTASNTATFVPKSDFTWLQGQEHIQKYQRETGSTSHFCSRCGSPVPNPLRNFDKYWVPAGLLDDTNGPGVVADICLDSKASWDPLVQSPNPHATMPDFDTLHDILRKDRGN